MASDYWLRAHSGSRIIVKYHTCNCNACTRDVTTFIRYKEQNHISYVWEHSSPTTVKYVEKKEMVSQFEMFYPYL